MERETGSRGADERNWSASGPLRLSTARLISAVLYVGSLATYIVVGSLVSPQKFTGFASLGWIMLGVGIADYIFSLWFEGLLLSPAGWKKSADGAPARITQHRAAAAAIIISTFGVSIAIYGVVLALLSFEMWAWYLYGLCALHGLHLHLRWDRYEEAVRRPQTHLD